MKAVLLEGLLVAMLGAALAFGANSISPLGLKLNRDYFPHTASVPVTPRVIKGPTPTPGSPGATAPDNSGQSQLAARLKEEGLGLVTSNQVTQILADPRCGADLLLIIDARNETEYQKGHIPGALLLDHYYPDKYLPAVLPLCLKAEQIVLYCHGGDKCEDSEFTAKLLRDAGIPSEKLSIYGGGITEWCANQNQVELGPRKSGQMGKCPQ